MLTHKQMIMVPFSVVKNNRLKLQTYKSQDKFGVAKTLLHIFSRYLAIKTICSSSRGGLLVKAAAS